MDNRNEWLDLGMGTRILKSEIISIEPPEYQGSSPERTTAIITVRNGKEYRAQWNRVGDMENLERMMGWRK